MSGGRKEEGEGGGGGGGRGREEVEVPSSAASIACSSSPLQHLIALKGSVDSGRRFAGLLNELEKDYSDQNSKRKAGLSPGPARERLSRALARSA